MKSIVNNVNKDMSEGNNNNNNNHNNDDNSNLSTNQKI